LFLFWGHSILLGFLSVGHQKVTAHFMFVHSLKSQFQAIVEWILEVFLEKQIKHFLI
jgi:hypothetical protein